MDWEEMDFNEFINEFIEEHNACIGIEAAEEEQEDSLFIFNEFESFFPSVVEQFCFLTAGSQDFINPLLATFMGGISRYRQWLADRGVDVRALEGRS